MNNAISQAKPRTTVVKLSDAKMKSVLGGSGCQVEAMAFGKAFAAPSVNCGVFVHL